MLEALGNLGDFIGGIAVVATLIYLAIQLRQNTAQLQRSAQLAGIDSRDTTFEAFSRFRTQIVSSPEVAALYLKGMADLGSLDLAERLRFGMLAEELFYILQTSLTRHNAVTRVGELEARELGVDVILRSPGITQWWSGQKCRFDSEFVEFIDSQISLDESAA